MLQAFLIIKNKLWTITKVNEYHTNVYILVNKWDVMQNILDMNL